MDLSRSVVHGVTTKESSMYLSKATEELYRKIEFFSKRGGALLIITGEPRTGKTTFAKYLAEHLSMDEYETVLISIMSDEVKTGWLIPKVCTRLGIELKNNNMSLSEFLSTKLEELFEENKNLTIIVDGAERIRTSQAFEEIEFLSDIQTLSDNKINFVLMGEDLLLEKIKSTPLVNKISYFCNFPLLDKDEIYDYFCYRTDELRISKSLMSEDGIDYICQLSEGKISNVVMILDNCLIEAKLKNLTKIDRKMINQVVNSHILMFKENGVNVEADNSSEEILRPLGGPSVSIPDINDITIDDPNSNLDFSIQHRQDGQQKLQNQLRNKRPGFLRTESQDKNQPKDKNTSIDKIFNKMYTRDTKNINPFDEDKQKDVDKEYNIGDDEREFFKLLKKSKVKA